MNPAFTLKEVLEATGGRPENPGPANPVFANFSTDSRRIEAGDLFIPLKGENFDGHAFLASVLAVPGVWALAKEDYPLETPSRLIRVKDPLTAYQQLALYHRKRFKNLKVVGITGSCGKTTSKDIIAGLLKSRFRLLNTPGNLNNEIGVPQTLLKLTPEHEILILEMGMRGLGEIKQLAQMALPDVGVITNIGESHLELLGSVENIVKAKCELLDHLAPQGLAVLNADSPQYPEMLGHCRGRILSFGIENPADIRLLSKRFLNWEGWELKISVKGREWNVKIPFLGEQIFYNVLSGVALAAEFGLSATEAEQAFKNMKITGMRMEKRLAPNGVYLINDAYNASPASLANALQTVKSLEVPGRKFAVLGDMLELGERSLEGHRECGELAAQSGISTLLCFGEKALEICRAAKAAGLENSFSFADKGKIVEYLQQNLKPGDLLLLKASRRLALETVSRDLWGEGL